VNCNTTILGMAGQLFTKPEMDNGCSFSAVQARH
jgi:hypothetical protein